ncbi:MAG: ribosome silencing factor [Gammaproteobacteria bacterium]|nr:ribosome silencing factor [Gammaproteobacteria bacterium]
MQVNRILAIATAALEEIKALDLVTLDVSDRTSVTDYMVIASGTSERHVRALTGNVVRCAKQAGTPPLGVEGERGGEWALVDLGDVIVHVMLPRVRQFYQLEKLWSVELEDGAEAPEPTSGLPRRGQLG